ncbi:MAG: nucleotidyl transferase AbiEii/AbiGii toxin family protein [Dehalococcoidia bacterium]|nr:nucleotidyl transferase AbiEii/AbiGii toxin family protein [Dehalococcoidia bacterium]
MRYETAAAFRRALEDRLKERSHHAGAGLARLRKQVAFDRLLARLVRIAPGEWALKGGFALQLRMSDRARTTRDVDLAWRVHENELLDRLIEATIEDLGDFFSFRVERTTADPDRMGGAHRFRVEASLAGRFFETFLLDVGEWDGPTAAQPEALTTPDLLGFAGIEPVTVPAIPLTRQVAEKLHAYTRRYEGGRVSSRPKDLVDLALIAQLFSLDAAALLQDLQYVFVSRGTHDLPPNLPTPPADWRLPYRQLAIEVGLDADLNAGHMAVAVMLDPVLQGRLHSGAWNPQARQWDG